MMQVCWYCCRTYNKYKWLMYVTDMKLYIVTERLVVVVVFACFWFSSGFIFCYSVSFLSILAIISLALGFLWIFLPSSSSVVFFLTALFTLPFPHCLLFTVALGFPLFSYLYLISCPLCYYCHTFYFYIGYKLHNSLPSFLFKESIIF